MIKSKLYGFIAMLSSIFSCATIPTDIRAVENFDLEKYLGTWYEIARLDHSFERNLIKVTATYSKRDDGGVKVLNQGYDKTTGELSTAEGKAYFVEDADTGRLKVSFFGPFYGGYNIFDLDEQNYEYAMICGNSKDYLWILSRKPTLDETILNRLLEKAKALGFETDKLIYPQEN